MVDPLGRMTLFTYANQIDLAAIAQVTQNGVHRRDYGTKMTSKTKQRRRSVHLLQHVAGEGADDVDIKVLGIYPSRRRGEAAIKRLIKLPGPRRYPMSFYLERHRLNELEWTEGFVTMRSIG